MKSSWRFDVSGGERGRSASSKAAFDGGPVLVLVADEPGLRKLVRLTLEPDCAVLEADDGDQAWALIREHRPPLALLAVRILGRNGLELTRAIKGDPDLANTLVFLVSTTTQAPEVAAGWQAGADDYIVKPFSPIGLMDRVNNALRHGLRCRPTSDSPQSLIHAARC